MVSLESEIPSIDLRSAINGAVRRWWIIALAVTSALGIVGLQDLGLGSTTLPTITVVERRYEPLNEIDELGLARIEPSMIIPTPSFENQLAILTSPEMLVRLRRISNSSANMEVTRSEPKFTIIDSVDNANNRVSFLSTGTPIFNFKCFGSDENECIRLTDAYVDEAIKLRKESVLGGLNGAASLTQQLIDLTKQKQADPMSPETLSAQASEIAILETKRLALSQAISAVTGGFIPISDGTYQIGGQVSTVSTSTYGFAATVGLIIGLLLALQLSYMDSTIRYAWQIWRIDRGIRILGSPRPRADAVQVTAVAAAIEHAALNGAKSVQIWASSTKLHEFASEVLRLVPQVSSDILTSIESASVQQLANQGNKTLVVLVEIAKMKRLELIEVIGIAKSGGVPMLGVALIS